LAVARLFLISRCARRVDDDQVIASSFGKDHPLPFAMKELEPKGILKGFDLMADCALRDVQLIGGAREAFASGRSLESLQAIQRWETTCHRCYEQIQSTIHHISDCWQPADKTCANLIKFSQACLRKDALRVEASER
jgi:hypothetical protein